MMRDTTGQTARAWRCEDCTRLTVRLEREPEPRSCEHCPGGQLTPQPLRPPTRRSQ